VVRWSWVLLALAAVALGAGAFAAGMMWAGEETSKVDVPKLSADERELQKVKVAASTVQLVEASKGPGGWTVRVVQETGSLAPENAQTAAVRFFRELARTGVAVAESSLELRTSTLKDVWGNTLKDVPIFRVELAGETFKRVNWMGFEPKNLERIADYYWEHDLLRQARKSAQGEGGASSSPDQQAGEPADGEG